MPVSIIRLFILFTDSVTKGVYTNIRSVLIFPNDRLLYEEYWPGNDEVRGKGIVGKIDHHRGSHHDRNYNRSDLPKIAWDIFPDIYPAVRRNKNKK